MILSGLFGEPDRERPPNGMPAAKFLEAALPRARDQEPTSTAIALHPYAVDAEDLEELVEEVHESMVENHDRGAASTSPRWAGARRTTPTVVAFEQGIAGPGDASCARPTNT